MEQERPSKYSPISELERSLNNYDFPAFEASALKGDGVFETLKMVSKNGFNER